MGSFVESLDQYYAYTDSVAESIISWVQDGASYPPAPTAEWPVARLGTALLIAGAYLAFVAFGRVIMGAMSDFKDALYPFRFVYNMAQVVLCSYMAVEAFLVAYRQGYGAMPCVPFVHGEGAPMANVLWLFYVSKILDFADTFFIVAGKKWKQLSFLHVYHHTTIFLFYWLNLHVNYDGDIYLTIVLNGLIHAMMYTYYFVSLHQKNIWWKSFLTSGQMLQFCLMMTQAALLLTRECNELPRRVIGMYFVYIFSLFLLFGQFFVASYMRPTKPKAS